MSKKLTLLLILIIALSLFSCRNTKDDLSSLPLPAEQEIPPSSPLENNAVEISFIACGDNITYGTKDARSKAIPGGRSLNFKPQYALVADKIANADIAFINQECIMAGDGYPIRYYPMFNVPQELGLDLVELGYDVINIATNHMLDAGSDGLKSTIDFWKSQDVLMIGGYENKEDFDTVRILEKDGVKFAFLSYTYSTNGLSKPASSPIEIPYINDEDIIRQTALARDAADFIFVSMHWGDEYHFDTNSEQRRVAQLLADCGVDAIIGHHPHVIQPLEWLTGKDGNKTLCVYSLGNFVAEQDHDYSMVGGILELNIVSVNNSKPYIEEAFFHPTVFHFTGDFYTNIVYPMEDYTSTLASIHGVRTYYGNRLDFTTLINYAKNTISEEFLTENFIETFKDY